MRWNSVKAYFPEAAAGHPEQPAPASPVWQGGAAGLLSSFLVEPLPLDE